MYYTYTFTAKTIGDGGWTDAIAKARAAVALLTNEEKANLTLGSTSIKGCSGFVGPLSKLGFGGLCLQDNENGVRGAPLVNGYAAQLSIGASWNRSLAYERGLHIGKEHKVKGVSVALGPVSRGLQASMSDLRND
jgi:beta-glucosidase